MVWCRGKGDAAAWIPLCMVGKLWWVYSIMPPDAVVLVMGTDDGDNATVTA